MLKLYNTLTRTIEEFVPIHPPKVGIYSCGPTVYDFQHIGHMRRYVGDDLLIRTLKYNGYEVKHVMNITDVGHLVSDSDTGEDKMEKGAKKFGLSVWDIAKKFEQQFFDSIDLLGIKRPDMVVHATDAIQDQIDLIQILEEKGYTYTIADGVYFDTSKFKNYFKLSGQNPEELKAGVRVDVVPGKKHITDFALWKFSPKDEKREMEWESPWARPPATSSKQSSEKQGDVAGEVGRGVGFPGWHIECSAMSMKALGPTFDIHTGGIDHISIHHTNEIAQSEAASGRKFVNYWVHHNFLTVEKQKMSKSIGNIFTAQDVADKGFHPLSLRYLYLQTHYRQEMNFTWNALTAAQKSLERLWGHIVEFKKEEMARKKISCAEFNTRFTDAVNDDLNMPQALAIAWELVKSDYPAYAKIDALLRFDHILGLGFWEVYENGFTKTAEKIPARVMELVQERKQMRKAKRFSAADHLRNTIQKMGYEVKDKENGETEVTKIILADIDTELKSLYTKK